MNKKSYLTFDFIIVLAVLCLISFGVRYIYSSGFSSDGVNTSSEYIKQIVWAISGFGLMTMIILIDYKYFFELSFYIYGGCILLLFITLLLGNKVNGARSWLGIGGFGIQPSEFAKLGTIIALSSFCSKNKKNLRTLSVFLRALMIPTVPIICVKNIHLVSP